MTRTVLSLLILVLADFFSPSVGLGAPAKPFLVVIDPGHGGSDHGATFRSGRRVFREKEQTLSVSKELARILKKKGIRAILTRREDREISLSERTAMANRLGANVFVSVHMNSVRKRSRHSKTAQGAETYILNHSTDKKSKRLADLENSVLEGSIADSEDQSDVALIVKDLLLDGNRVESQKLACAVQERLARATSPNPKRKRNRGVKQALFYVLLGADMPSILVETGFLSHPHDRRKIASRKGKVQVASAIADGILNYRKQLSRGPQVAKKSASLSKCQVR